MALRRYAKNALDVEKKPDLAFALHEAALAAHEAMLAITKRD